jgi:hypothetical protein
MKWSDEHEMKPEMQLKILGGTYLAICTGVILRITVSMVEDPWAVLPHEVSLSVGSNWIMGLWFLGFTLATGISLLRLREWGRRQALSFSLLPFVFVAGVTIIGIAGWFFRGIPSSLVRVPLELGQTLWQNTLVGDQLVDWLYKIPLLFWALTTPLQFHLLRSTALKELTSPSSDDDMARSILDG